jgi:DNA-binding response OmpR family regulator
MGPIRILIVEDVDTMRYLLGIVLSDVPGMSVSGMAANGWEARLELSRRRPDIVLLDEVLPGESSIELLAELRASGIPVLMITGMESPAHPIPEGAEGRILKPGWKSVAEDRERIQASILRALGSHPQAFT